MLFPAQLPTDSEASVEPPTDIPGPGGDAGVAAPSEGSWEDGSGLEDLPVASDPNKVVRLLLKRRSSVYMEYRMMPPAKEVGREHPEERDSVAGGNTIEEEVGPQVEVEESSMTLDAMAQKSSGLDDEKCERKDNPVMDTVPDVSVQPCTDDGDVGKIDDVKENVEPALDYDATKLLMEGSQSGVDTNVPSTEAPVLDDSLYVETGEGQILDFEIIGDQIIFKKRAVLPQRMPTPEESAVMEPAAHNEVNVGASDPQPSDLLSLPPELLMNMPEDLLVVADPDIPVTRTAPIPGVSASSRGARVHLPKSSHTAPRPAPVPTGCVRMRLPAPPLEPPLEQPLPSGQPLVIQETLPIEMMLTTDDHGNQELVPPESVPFIMAGEPMPVTATPPAMLPPPHLDTSSPTPIGSQGTYYIDQNGQIVLQPAPVLAPTPPVETITLVSDEQALTSVVKRDPSLIPTTAANMAMSSIATSLESETLVPSSPRSQVLAAMQGATVVQIVPSTLVDTYTPIPVPSSVQSQAASTSLLPSETNSQMQHLIHSITSPKAQTLSSPATSRRAQPIASKPKPQLLTDSKPSLQVPPEPLFNVSPTAKPLTPSKVAMGHSGSVTSAAVTTQASPAKLDVKSSPSRRFLPAVSLLKKPVDTTKKKLFQTSEPTDIGIDPPQATHQDAEHLEESREKYIFSPRKKHRTPHVSASKITILQKEVPGRSAAKVRDDIPILAAESASSKLGTQPKQVLEKERAKKKEPKLTTPKIKQRSEVTVAAKTTEPKSRRKVKKTEVKAAEQTVPEISALVPDVPPPIESEDTSNDDVKEVLVLDSAIPPAAGTSVPRHRQPSTAAATSAKLDDLILNLKSTPARRLSDKEKPSGSSSIPASQPTISSITLGPSKIGALQQGIPSKSLPGLGESLIGKSQTIYLGTTTVVSEHAELQVGKAQTSSHRDHSTDTSTIDKSGQPEEEKVVHPIPEEKPTEVKVLMKGKKKPASKAVPSVSKKVDTDHTIHSKKIKVKSTPKSIKTSGKSDPSTSSKSAQSKPVAGTSAFNPAKDKPKTSTPAKGPGVKKSSPKSVTNLKGNNPRAESILKNMPAHLQQQIKDIIASLGSNPSGPIKFRLPPGYKNLPQESPNVKMTLLSQDEARKIGLPVPKPQAGPSTPKAGSSGVPVSPARSGDRSATSDSSEEEDLPQVDGPKERKKTTKTPASGAKARVSTKRKVIKPKASGSVMKTVKKLAEKKGITSPLMSRVHSPTKGIRTPKKGDGRNARTRKLSLSPTTPTHIKTAAAAARDRAEAAKRKLEADMETKPPSQPPEQESKDSSAVSTSGKSSEMEAIPGTSAGGDTSFGEEINSAEEDWETDIPSDVASGPDDISTLLGALAPKSAEMEPDSADLAVGTKPLPQLTLEEDKVEEDKQVDPVEDTTTLMEEPSQKNNITPDPVATAEVHDPVMTDNQPEPAAVKDKTEADKSAKPVAATKPAGSPRPQRKRKAVTQPEDKLPETPGSGWVLWEHDNYFECLQEHHIELSMAYCKTAVTPVR